MKKWVSHKWLCTDALIPHFLFFLTIHLSVEQSPNLQTFKEPRNRFQGLVSASLQYVAWQTSTSNRIVEQARHLGLNSWSPYKVYKYGLTWQRTTISISNCRQKGAGGIAALLITELLTLTWKVSAALVGIVVAAWTKYIWRHQTLNVG